jgi:hypothetical protein
MFLIASDGGEAYDDDEMATPTKPSVRDAIVSSLSSSTVVFVAPFVDREGGGRGALSTAASSSSFVDLSSSSDDDDPNDVIILPLLPRRESDSDCGGGEGTLSFSSAMFIYNYTSTTTFALCRGSFGKGFMHAIIIVK